MLRRFRISLVSIQCSRCLIIGYFGYLPTPTASQPIAELYSDIDDTFLVVLCLTPNTFYSSFYTTVQPHTFSDQEIIAKF